MGFGKLSSKYLTILLICEESLIRDKIYNSLKKYYLQIDLANDDFQAINLYQNNKYNIVILDSHIRNVSLDVMVFFIREIKKNQVIFLLNDNKSRLDLNVTETFYTPLNPRIFAKTLLSYNKNILQRTQLREEIIKNRLNLFLNQKNKNFSFIYALNESGYKVDDDLFIWEGICKNCLKVNGKFQNLIKSFKSEQIDNNYIKSYATILNSYYQIFHLIKETNDLSHFFLKYSSVFYNLDDDVFEDEMKNLLEYIYIEIIYFQYILFFRNEIKNINYFKTCLFNTFKTLQNKIDLVSI